MGSNDLSVLTAEAVLNGTGFHLASPAVGLETQEYTTPSFG